MENYKKEELIEFLTIRKELICSVELSSGDRDEDTLSGLTMTSTMFSVLKK